MTISAPATGTLTLGAKPANSIPLVCRLAIETALIAALFHVRTGSTPQCIELATGRATRAATMLKRACATARTGSAS